MGVSLTNILLSATSSMASSGCLFLSVLADPCPAHHSVVNHRGHHGVIEKEIKGLVRRLYLVIDS